MARRLLTASITSTAATRTLKRSCAESARRSAGLEKYCRRSGDSIAPLLPRSGRVGAWQEFRIIKRTKYRRVQRREKKLPRMGTMSHASARRLDCVWDCKPGVELH